MRGNGEALLDLINDILDLAKIESGHLSLELVEFDLEEQLGRVGEMMAMRAHQKGLELAIVSHRSGAKLNWRSSSAATNPD
jgi:two-component system sensor histidine kinase/response regulator